MFYTIGEIAKRMGVAPSALRYYEREGLLPFVERSDGGLRLFKEEDIGWLAMIDCLKRTEMPLKDIKIFIEKCMMGDDTLEERLRMIEEQKKYARSKLAELQKALEELDYKEWYYKTALTVGNSKAVDEFAEEDIPMEFREIRRNMKFGTDH